MIHADACYPTKYCRIGKSSHNKVHWCKILIVIVRQPMSVSISRVNLTNRFVPSCPRRNLLKLNTSYLWEPLTRNMVWMREPSVSQPYFWWSIWYLCKDWLLHCQIYDYERGTYLNWIQLTCEMRNLCRWGSPASSNHTCLPLLLRLPATCSSFQDTS